MLVWFREGQPFGLPQQRSRKREACESERSNGGFETLRKACLHAARCTPDFLGIRGIQVGMSLSLRRENPSVVGGWVLRYANDTVTCIWNIEIKGISKTWSISDLLLMAISVKHL